VLKRLLEHITSRPAATPRLPYPHLDLFHWSPRDGSVNFGDRLSDIVCRQMLAGRGLSFDDQVARSCRLLAIGSILHFAENGNHVWGSGWNGKVAEEHFKARHLTVHAVRGPLTAEFLRRRGIQVPEVFGDPALLLPQLFGNRFRPTPMRDHVFVPNLHDIAVVGNHPNVVSPLWGWNVTLRSVLNARLVLASSLHGLIVAEAFGLPARYVRLSQTEDLFKYRDYYLGSGRNEADFVFARSIEEGLEMGGAPPVRHDPTPLLQAFPFGLWQEAS
jgi:pyruvyltransferase